MPQEGIESRTDWLIAVCKFFSILEAQWKQNGEQYHVEDDPREQQVATQFTTSEPREKQIYQHHKTREDETVSRSGKRNKKPSIVC